MFRIIDSPQFTHEIEVSVPVDGGYERQSLRARYRVLPTDEAAGYDLAQPSVVREFLDRAVLRLDDLVDDEGKPLEWNDRIRDAAFGLPYLRVALIRGYFEGVAGARRKN